MVSITSKFLGFSHTQLWFPKSPEEIERALEASVFVTLMQVDGHLLKEFDRFAFRKKIFYTTILDLTRDETTLWRRLSKKSTRYEIRRAEKEQPTICINEFTNEAYELVNRFRLRRGLGKPSSRQEWSAILKVSDVWCALYDGQVYIVHILLKDGLSRVRLLASATEDRTRDEVRRWVGAVNRFMHWREILYYKSKGVRFYDFGGVELDRSSPMYTITQFKMSFGGDIVEEYIARLTRRKTLKALMQVAYRARDIGRKIAWKR